MFKKKKKEENEVEINQPLIIHYKKRRLLTIISWLTVFFLVIGSFRALTYRPPTYTEQELNQQYMLVDFIQHYYYFQKDNSDEMQEVTKQLSYMAKNTITKPKYDNAVVNVTVPYSTIKIVEFKKIGTKIEAVLIIDIKLTYADKITTIQKKVKLIAESYNDKLFVLQSPIPYIQQKVTEEQKKAFDEYIQQQQNIYDGMSAIGEPSATQNKKMIQTFFEFWSSDIAKAKTLALNDSVVFDIKKDVVFDIATLTITKQVTDKTNSYIFVTISYTEDSVTEITKYIITLENQKIKEIKGEI